MFFPLQLAYTLLNRQQSQSQDLSAPSVPLLQTWYSGPPQQPTTEHPFPVVPPAPADFASPIPLGPMVAVQSLLGFPPTATAASVADTGQGQGICWDPAVGMFHAAGTGLFEQEGIQGNTA